LFGLRYSDANLASILLAPSPQLTVNPVCSNIRFRRVSINFYWSERDRCWTWSV